MGSLNSNGDRIAQDTKVTRHFGPQIKVSNYVNGGWALVANSGGIDNDSFSSSSSMYFGPGSTSTSGIIPLSSREVDTSVNRQLFTQDASASGALQWEYTRTVDIHTSISSLISENSGPSETISERKVFASGWTIFSAGGEAVGASTGTTDTDVTPSGLGTG